YVAQAFYDLYVATGNKADLEMARKINDENLPRFAEFTRYVLSLSPSARSLIGYDLDNLEFLASAIALQNRIDILSAIEASGDPDGLRETWAPRTSYDLHPVASQLIYVHGYKLPELVAEFDRSTGSSRMILATAIATLRAAQKVGIDPMESTRKVLDQYGIDLEQWSNLL
ncbi:MAG: hypothetical protein K2M00_04645, partial [Muribaculaceae bacterium]|nr:hypothetical protein [Muribaculaceae bacterium]